MPVIERRRTASSNALGQPIDELTLESPGALRELLAPAEFEHRAAECVQLARDHNQALSLLSIALDRPPSAAAAQAEALAAFTRTCSATLRATDLLGCISDREVLALLPATNSTGALCAAERLRTAVAALSYSAADGRSRRLSVSIGVASTRGMRAALAPLRARAEVRRDDARSSGGNRVEA